MGDIWNLKLETLFSVWMLKFLCSTKPTKIWTVPEIMGTSWSVNFFRNSLNFSSLANKLSKSSCEKDHCVRIAWDFTSDFWFLEHVNPQRKWNLDSVWSPKNAQKIKLTLEEYLTVAWVEKYLVTNLGDCRCFDSVFKTLSLSIKRQSTKAAALLLLFLYRP